MITEGRGLDFGIERGPAGGEELADFEPGKVLAAGDMVQTGLVAGGEFPYRAGGGGSRVRRAEFVGSEGAKVGSASHEQMASAEKQRSSQSRVQGRASRAGSGRAAAGSE